VADGPEGFENEQGGRIPRAPEVAEPPVLDDLGPRGEAAAVRAVNSAQRHDGARAEAALAPRVRHLPGLRDEVTATLDAFEDEKRLVARLVDPGARDASGDLAPGRDQRSRAHGGRADAFGIDRAAGSPLGARVVYSRRFRNGFGLSFNTSRAVQGCESQRGLLLRPRSNPSSFFRSASGIRTVP